MKYFSTNNRKLVASFQEAVFNSLPADNGLYVPQSIPKLDAGFFGELKEKSKAEIGFEVAHHFVEGEIPDEELFRIVQETVDFDLPLVKVEKNIHALELFHGPTWAFKDVGARFLSRCMSYFGSEQDKEVHILVATSGDTGGAVAAGFHGVKGVKVTILYPKGKVSEVQRLQLTTWGDNIAALEVDGTFDDCQRMVKAAFLDKELNDKISLSSANSINIARLIPQSFYYYYAFQQLGNWDDVVVAVPSGNYGNLTAGLFAWKMGLPVKRFIAASNDNRIVPDYLLTGTYESKPSVQTYANAMDVGAPSNFVRMLELFEGSHAKMKEMISGFSLSNPDILEVMSECEFQNDYLPDPHGAIGYQALKKGLSATEQGIFLETAHPVKFLEVVDMALGASPDYADMIAQWEQKPSHFTSIPADFEAMKGVLI
jgi:threonine synthase